MQRIQLDFGSRHAQRSRRHGHEQRHFWVGVSPRGPDCRHRWITVARGGGAPLAVWLPLLIQCESLASLLLNFLVPVAGFEGLLLPFDRGRKVAGLGVSGGEGVHKEGGPPTRELASPGSEPDRSLAIPQIVLRAGSQQPCEEVVREEVLGVEADALGEVRSSLLEIPPALVGDSPQATEVAFFGSEVDGSGVVCEGLLVLSLRVVCFPPPGVMGGILGLEAYSLGKCCDSLVVLLVLEVCVALPGEGGSRGGDLGGAILVRVIRLGWPLA